MLGHGADADDGLDEQLVAQGILHGGGHLLQVLLAGSRGDLLDHGDVRLVDAQNEVLELIREHTAQHIHRRHIPVAHLPDQEHGPGGIGGEMQFLGPDVDVTGEDVVHDDVLDEGAPVMLVLVIILGVAQGHIGGDAHTPGQVVLAGAEHGVLDIVGGAHHGLEGLLGIDDGIFEAGADLDGRIGPALTQQGHIGTGHHAAFRIHHAENTIRCILQLNDHALENTIGHCMLLLRKVHKHGSYKIMILLYIAFWHFASTF